MNQIVQIDNLYEKELEIYHTLKENQLYHINEPDLGMFIAESPNVILRALGAGYEPHSILIEEKQLTDPRNEIRQILDQISESVPIYTAPEEVLSQITGFHLTRGMLCAMKRKHLPELCDLVKDKKRIAILENVVNPTNVGAIIRSAAALNMDAVILTSGCSDPLYRRAIRVSMGCIFQIPFTVLPSEDVWPDNTIDQLHRLGYKTAAMALSDQSVSIDDPNLLAEDKLAIILGTEGDGLADTTIADCDYTVKIPMTHGVDSLNVAAASAVAFWQLGSRS